MSSVAASMPYSLFNVSRISSGEHAVPFRPDRTDMVQTARRPRSGLMDTVSKANSLARRAREHGPIASPFVLPAPLRRYSTSLLHPVDRRFRVLIVSRSHGIQSFVLLGFSDFLERQYVFKLDTPVSSRLFEGNLSSIEESNDCRPGHAQKLCRLLGRQSHRTGCDRNCQALTHSLNGLNEHFVDFVRDLNLITGIRAGKEELRRRLRTILLSMGLHEVVDLPRLRCLWCEEGFFGRCTHSHSVLVFRFLRIYRFVRLSHASPLRWRRPVALI